MDILKALNGAFYYGIKYVMIPIDIIQIVWYWHIGDVDHLLRRVLGLAVAILLLWWVGRDYKKSE